jgi:hypothetical protein
MAIHGQTWHHWCKIWARQDSEWISTIVKTIVQTLLYYSFHNFFWVEWSGVERQQIVCIYEKLAGNGVYLPTFAGSVGASFGGALARGKWCFPVYLVARKSVREDLENRWEVRGEEGWVSLLCKVTTTFQTTKLNNTKTWCAPGAAAATNDFGNRESSTKFAQNLPPHMHPQICSSSVLQQQQQQV